MDIKIKEKKYLKCNEKVIRNKQQYTTDTMSLKLKLKNLQLKKIDTQTHTHTCRNREDN